MILKEPPTPEEFTEVMLLLQKKADDELSLEEVHMEMDDYILTVLESLGFKKGVDVFRSTPKWYG